MLDDARDQRLSSSETPNIALQWPGSGCHLRPYDRCARASCKGMQGIYLTSMISNAGMMRMHVRDCSWMGMHGHFKAGRGLCTSLRDCVHVFEDVQRVNKHSGSDREENYPLIFPRAISLSESLRTCQ